MEDSDPPCAHHTMPAPIQTVPEKARQNGDFPASTIAAQIVDDHLTRGRIHPKHQDREKFRRLLREILYSDENTDEVTRVIETDNNVNCRLIYVVVRAGLEPALNEDPFEKKDELIKQALESLSVVELTLQRSPDVLFSVLEGRESDPQLDGPLFLWLVPRLSIMLGRTKDKEIHEGILRVLKTTLVMERKCRPQLKPQLVLKYIQGCIKDLLFFVEDLHQDTSGLRESLVPSMATIAEVFPLQAQQNHSRIPVQVCIQDAPQASIIILSLLSTMTTFQSKGSRETPTVDLNSLELSWTLSGLMRLWSTISFPKDHLAFEYLSEQCLIILLEILCGIMSKLVRVKIEVVNLPGALVLFSQIIAALLVLGPASLGGVLEKAICLAIFEISRLFELSPMIVEAFDEHLLPVILEITGSQSPIMDFGMDLQVCGTMLPNVNSAYSLKAISTTTSSHSYSKRQFDQFKAFAHPGSIISRH